MNNYSLLIIGEEPEKRLKLLQAGDEITLPLECLTFVDMEEEFRQQYETQNFKLMGIDKPFKYLYDTFDDFMKGFCGWNGPNELNGKYGIWKNPKARFRSFCIGGACHYAGELRLKPDITPLWAERQGYDIRNRPITPFDVSRAFKWQIDFEFMRQERLGLFRTKYDNPRLSGIQLANPDLQLGKLICDPHKDESFWNYIGRCYVPWCTSVFIDSNDKWHQCPSVLNLTKEWASEFDELVSQTRPADLFTVATCHIGIEDMEKL